MLLGVRRSIIPIGRLIIAIVAIARFEIMIDGNGNFCVGHDKVAADLAAGGNQGSLTMSAVVRAQWRFGWTILLRLDQGG